MNEIWKGIKGYDGYPVGSVGNIRSFKYKTPRILKLHRNPRSEYWQVWLYKSGRKTELFVHRLVAEAFIPNSENKPQVNHKNGIKTDNRVDNLERVTPSENQRHAVAMGLSPQGEDHPGAKLTDEQVRLIRSPYKPRDKEFGVKAPAKNLVSVLELFNASSVQNRRRRNPQFILSQIFSKRKARNLSSVPKLFTKHVG